ncbi:alpha/beta hydrolase [Ferruginibacter sp.]|nr:alpha/beta hydrolase [Ferruginibacter sp.]
MKPMGYLLLIFFLFISSSSASQNQDPIPVYESFSIESKQVVETRTINVWTPPGYLTNVDSFTVLYMADGGMKEDFPHIANTIAELVKSKKIPPVILVGIENTQRRRDLTGPTEIKEDKKIAPVVGGAEKFRAFIKEELFFEINKRYRTTNKRGIIGESLAGLFVVETFLYNPDMFSYYIAMDPSLWWNNHYLVRTAKDHLSKLSAGEKRFWFAGSSVTDISLHTKELDNILKSENRLNLKWNYSDEPKEKHHTIFRATKEKALIWTFDINENDR